MGYATIMVHVEAGAAAEARMRVATALADRFDAALIGLAADTFAPPVAHPMAGAALMADAMQAERERIEAELRAAADRFRAVAGAEERRLGWRSFVDDPAETLAREARAADLLVLGRDPEAAGRASFRAADPGDVLMRAGRPVLVTPPGAPTPEARRILLAWKDTREARRALADALPFLRRAEDVAVIEVVADATTGADAARRLEDVVDHLARHRVAASAAARVRREPSVAEELVAEAGRRGADLIVAGGYGHGRLREWVFGGVTRGLLARCPFCCLLSH
jgi:nucleotide-binding universal stress UspA family protein